MYNIRMYALNVVVYNDLYVTYKSVYTSCIHDVYTLKLIWLHENSIKHMFGHFKCKKLLGYSYCKLFVWTLGSTYGWVRIPI